MRVSQKHLIFGVSVYKMCGFTSYRKRIMTPEIGSNNFTLCTNPYSTISTNTTSADANLNKEEIAKILQTINDIPKLEDLQKFGITKRAIIELAKKRSSGESVANLDELILILGSRASSRPFSNILKGSMLKIKNPIYPVPTEEQVQKTSVVLSLIIAGNSFSWCCIEKKMGQFVVQSLNHQTNTLNIKSHFLSILKEMVALSNQIPKSHMCIIEEYPATNSNQNPYMFQFQLHMSQMREFLLGSIAAQVDPPQIIAIKALAVARLFNIAIGSERVSGQHVVDNLVTWKRVPSLVVPNNLKADYENLQPTIKEGLANSLLLNLAYWKLTKQFTDFCT